MDCNGTRWGMIMRGGARKVHRKIANRKSAMRETVVKSGNCALRFAMEESRDAHNCDGQKCDGGICDGAIGRVANNCDGSNGQNK